MRIGLSIRVQDAVAVLSALAMGLLMTQFVFYFLQSNEAHRVFRGIESIFRSEEIGSDPFRISRELLDLEESGAIRCPTLSTDPPIHEPFLDRGRGPGCTEEFWILNGAFVRQNVSSINNRTWTVSAVIPNTPFFYVALWISRFAVVLSILGAGVVVLYKRKSIAHQLLLAKKEHEHIQEIKKITRQVAHDIRSPLSALNSLLGSVGGIPLEARSVLESITQRINGIANDLLEKPRRSPPHTHDGALCESHCVGPLIERIVEEKKIQLRSRDGISIETDLSEFRDAKAPLDPSEFLRLLSNLINNSIESTQGSVNKIQVHLREFSNEIEIAVSDQGCGIPHAILNRLGEEGLSSKRRDGDSGSGLGIWHAKRCVQKWGGRFHIQSQPGIGTIVSIVLPLEVKSLRDPIP